MHIVKCLIKICFLISLFNCNIGYSSNIDCIELVKIKPSQYEVVLNCDKSTYEVELKQRFHKDWRIYLVSENYDEKNFNFINKKDVEALSLKNTDISNNMLIEISDVEHKKNEDGFNRWEVDKWVKYYTGKKYKLLLIYYPELIYTFINNFLFYLFYPAILLFLTIKGISWQIKKR